METVELTPRSRDAAALVLLLACYVVTALD
jgi:hypothetical protein